MDTHLLSTPTIPSFCPSKFPCDHSQLYWDDNFTRNRSLCRIISNGQLVSEPAELKTSYLKHVKEILRHVGRHSSTLSAAKDKLGTSVTSMNEEMFKRHGFHIHELCSLQDWREYHMMSTLETQYMLSKNDREIMFYGSSKQESKSVIFSQGSIRPTSRQGPDELGLGVRCSHDLTAVFRDCTANIVETTAIVKDRGGRELYRTDGTPIFSKIMQLYVLVFCVQPGVRGPAGEKTINFGTRIDGSDGLEKPVLALQSNDATYDVLRRQDQMTCIGCMCVQVNLFSVATLQMKNRSREEYWSDAQQDFIDQCISEVSNCVARKPP